MIVPILYSTAIHKNSHQEKRENLRIRKKKIVDMYIAEDDWLDRIASKLPKNNCKNVCFHCFQTDHRVLKYFGLREKLNTDLCVNERGVTSMSHS